MNKEINKNVLSKEQIEGMSFEYQDSFWNEMETLLDKDASTKGKRIWWWVAAVSGLIFVSGGMLLLFNTSVSNETSSIQSVEKENSLSKLNNETSVTAIGNESVDYEEEVEQIERSSVDEISPTDFSKNTSKTTAINTSEKQVYTSTSGVNTKTEKTKTDIAKDLSNSQPIESKSTVSSGNVLYNEGLTSELVVVQEGIDERITMPKLGNPLKVSEGSLIHPRTLAQPKTWVNSTYLTAGIDGGVNGLNPSSVNSFSGRVGVLMAMNYSRFGFRTGLLFQLNQLSGLSYMESRRVYNMYAWDAVNELTYKLTANASIPLLLTVSHRRFTLASGLRLNYLLNAKSDMKSWNSESVVPSTWGYVNGLNPFWMTLQMECFYAISKRIQIGCSVGIDATSRTSDEQGVSARGLKIWDAGINVNYQLK
jgi:hypothetical protein